MNAIHLVQSEDRLYPLGFHYDYVYQVFNNEHTLIGLIFLSELNGNKIYIEWLEFFCVFRSKGYLRALFIQLTTLFKEKEIHLECGEELLRKYISIGCEEHGINDCTDNYMLTYAAERSNT